MLDVISDLLQRLSAARAANLDAAISSRAPASTALSTADFTAGRATNLDAALSGRLGTVINSIQYGTIASNTNGATATITSVNTAKSVVIYLGFTSGGGVASTCPALTLTNGTTVTMNNGGTSMGTSPTTGFVVIEYK